MSEEELERYEAEIELALVQEYRAVLSMFSYVVETSDASTWPTRSPHRAIGHPAGLRRA